MSQTFSSAPEPILPRMGLSRRVVAEEVPAQELQIRLAGCPRSSVECVSAAHMKVNHLALHGVHRAVHGLLGSPGCLLSAYLIYGRP
jgi:hypothetical protein